jgi:long-chain acyl-CoA synthetase
MSMSVEEAVQSGMTIAYHAQQQPHVPALITPFGDRTFAELNQRANQLVRALRDAGIGAGDSIAVVIRNRPEFVEALVAADRSGIRFTPINYHLKGEEIGYIVDNCEAKAFIAEASLGETPTEALRGAPNVRLALSIGGEIEGFQSYDAVIDRFSGADIEDPSLGARMLYTSGTTGRPKGVYRETREPTKPEWEGSLANYRPGQDVNLCTGPAYHAAPLLINVITPLVSGATVVMMERWDAEETLRLTQQHRVTHTHMVATMFHRLLQLPEETRGKYDTSSMRLIIHGAAPCPVHVKRSMIEWFGPIVWEYYAATEGGGGFIVGSEEWLKKPGTVGRPGPEFDNRILDDDGNEVPTGTVGTIYMRAPAQGRFQYFKDDKKTASSYRGEHFTLGDMGYFDEDGYLFLTGRSAELIISGGVNIYPQEVDNELLKHPAVLDVCTIGAPNDEWGEEVKSVVQLRPGFEPSEQLSQELLAWARERLAHFKCPRTIDYSTDLPRLPSGKIQRRTVREPYWQGRSTR